jgi:hypothetical protein
VKDFGGVGAHVPCVSKEPWCVLGCSHLENYVGSETNRHEGLREGYRNVPPGTPQGPSFISWGLIWDKRLVL